jgi:hypothetical protein
LQPEPTCLHEYARNAGVAAFNPSNDHAAYLASDCCAAWFHGGVHVSGYLGKSGGGFKIDHPLAPADKFLNHFFVESSEMKNMYDGVVVANGKGEAVVELPKWFPALNREFRYQLTAIGRPAPDPHIAAEMFAKSRRFKIAGAGSRTKVVWQITATRQDRWARKYTLRVEERKTPKERGYYLHPELYGESTEKSIGSRRHPHSKERPTRPRRAAT